MDAIEMILSAIPPLCLVIVVSFLPIYLAVGE